MRKNVGETKWGMISSEQIRKKGEEEPNTRKLERKPLGWYGRLLRMMN